MKNDRSAVGGWGPGAQEVKPRGEREVGSPARQGMGCWLEVSLHFFCPSFIMHGLKELNGEGKESTPNFGFCLLGEATRAWRGERT